MSAKIVPLRKGETDRNATSGRLPNNVYRIREHLTEAEMDKLLAALKRNRHGHRDWLIGLTIYRHGLGSQRLAIRAGMTSTCRREPSSCAGSRTAPIASTTSLHSFKQ